MHKTIIKCLSKEDESSIYIHSVKKFLKCVRKIRKPISRSQYVYNPKTEKKRKYTTRRIVPNKM